MHKEKRLPLPRRGPMKRKRAAIDPFTRGKLRQFASEHPELKPYQLQEWFCKNFNYSVATSTIRNSLKPEEGTPVTYSEKRSKFKKRKANYPELEQKLLAWFYDLEDPARITDDAVLSFFSNTRR